MRGLKGRYANDKVYLFPLIMASPSPVINVPDVTVGATRRLIEQSVQKPVLAEAALHHEAKPMLILFVMTPTTISAISRPVTVIRTMVKYVHEINYSGPQKVDCLQQQCHMLILSFRCFIEMNVFFANLKYEADSCLLSPCVQNLKQHGICRRKRQPLSYNNIWSLLQQYLVPFQTIFGLLP